MTLEETLVKILSGAIMLDDVSEALDMSKDKIISGVEDAIKVSKGLEKSIEELKKSNHELKESNQELRELILDLAKEVRELRGK